MPINENMVQEIVQEVMANADSRRSDWQTWHFQRNE